MEFKDQLVVIRAKLNLTQEELAKELNVSFSTINRWECGKTKPTRKAVAVFNQYCKAKGINMEDLQ